MTVLSPPFYPPVSRASQPPSCPANSSSRERRQGRIREARQYNRSRRMSVRPRRINRQHDSKLWLVRLKALPSRQRGSGCTRLCDVSDSPYAGRASDRWRRASDVGARCRRGARGRADHGWFAGGCRTAGDRSAARNEPAVEKACGIDVTLVLDASGSVQSNAVGSVRPRPRVPRRVEGHQLHGPGASVRHVRGRGVGVPANGRRRDIRRRRGAPRRRRGLLQPAAPRPSDPTIHQYTRRHPASSSGSWSNDNSSIQYTNWQQVLELTATDSGELVVFITDGDPTAYDFDRPGDPFPAAATSASAPTGRGQPDTLDRAVAARERGQGNRVPGAAHRRRGRAAEPGQRRPADPGVRARRRHRPSRNSTSRRPTSRWSPTSTTSRRPSGRWCSSCVRRR